MPQMHLDPTEDLIGVTVEILDRTPELDGAFDITIRAQKRSAEYATIYSARWTGHMSDYFGDFFERVALAWLSGDAKDVQRAAFKVQTIARRHDRAQQVE